MRLSKTVKIDSKEYTIKELTLNDIIELLQKSNFLNTSGSGVEEQESSKKDDLTRLKSDLEEMMKRCCDFDIEDLKKQNVAPSEIKQLFDAFKEVNSDFLAGAKALGVTEIFTQLKVAALQNFSSLLAI